MSRIIKKQRINKVKSINDERNKIKKVIIEVLVRNNVKRAAFFGSFTSGEATEKSDVDLLVEFEGIK